MATKEEMINWAKDCVYRWIDIDGYYGAQCVDLTMAYTKIFGGYQMYGNALDYLKNPIPKNWIRYSAKEEKIAAGDIAIWQWSANDIFGHVGIVISVNNNLITSVEQNVDGTPERGGVARIKTRDNAHLVGFIRPFYDESRNWELKSENGKFTVLVTSINVRVKPSVTAKIVDNYSQGEIIYYDNYVINEGFIWISYISFGGERHYVATGTHGGNKCTSSWGEFKEQ